MKHNRFKRFLSLILVAALLAGYYVPGVQAASTGLSWKETDRVVKPDMTDRVADTQVEERYQPGDIVRVSIVLEEKSTIQSGYSTRNIAGNAQALAYSSQLKARQEALAQAISTQVLGGKQLDVVWNLTLAANLISANVPYGKIDAIAQVEGVKTVVLENTYLPCVVEREETVAEPQMYASLQMTGSSLLWSSGYTGAGSRIAILDTGTDTDHQSLDNGAYLYALEQNAAAAGVSFEEYVAGLDLLDAQEIASVLSYLNISTVIGDLTADQLYLTEKLPFAANYVDANLVVDHASDYQSEHGSHVAGIAAANRYVPSGDGYADALETVLMAGTAPDAQILTMKLFGSSGGPTDSDYMAAVEDAIYLGCDSVNLSLGSSVSGDSYNDYFTGLLEYMTTTDTVVVASAGNAFSWPETTMFGRPYTGDVAMDTVGTPGSLTNFFTVASVENDGGVGLVFKAAGRNTMYADGRNGSNLPFTTLDTSSGLTGTAYEFVFIDGIGNSEDYTGIELNGKIVFCSRGTTNFTYKAEVAVGLGAVATVVYNNQSGNFGMDFSAYSLTNPAASIAQEDAYVIRNGATAQTTDDGVTYYTGEIIVYGKEGGFYSDSDYYTMSDYSSWGVPGDLSLKPEITAPGGNIYSLYGETPYGGGSDQYELMSGTSMSAPAITGMAALLAQYLRESGLAEQTDLKVRTLSQSLLMSTAVPMMEAGSGSYYSLLKQGAGLARIDLATAAGSYILVDGQNDGKVKAELGDDPDRTGVYEFTFSINNLTGEEQTFTLRADVFRQDAYDPGLASGNQAYNFMVMDQSTIALDANATFSVDGVDVQTVTVPGSGSIDVSVRLALTDEAKQLLDETFENGTFVEAFVYAEEQTSAEGETGTSHSIPVLAFYGNWSDPNMFDYGTAVALMGGNYVGMVPYMYYNIETGSANALTIDYGDGGEYYFGGNPYLTDDAYLAERDAFNSEDASSIYGQYFTLIRNASAMDLVISNAETGEEYYHKALGEYYPAYYNVNGGYWQNVQQGTYVGWTGTDAQGNPLPEGTVVDVSLIAIPEYYRNADGTHNVDNLGSGIYLSSQFHIDNTAPEVTDMTLVESTLTVDAIDNRHVAAVVLFSGNGSSVIASGTPNQTEVNQEITLELDMTGTIGESFLLAAYDYAGNMNVYEITLELPEVVRPYFTVVDYPSSTYYGLNADGTYLKLATGNRGTIQAAEFVDGYVFEIVDGGALHVASNDDLSNFRFLSLLDPNNELGITNFTDLAYNYADETLYGLFYCEANSEAYPVLCTIDMVDGTMDILTVMPVDVQTMAISTDGRFYTVGYGSPDLYSFTLEELAAGTVNYVGEMSYYYTENFSSMAWDHNTGKLYRAYPNTLLEIDPETAEPTMVTPDYVSFMMTGLYIVPETYGDRFASTENVSHVTTDLSETRVLVGGTVSVSAQIWPWYVTDDSITWTSSNTSVATVNENGIVSGISEGTAIITAASSLDPTKTAQCAVKVEKLNKSLNAFVWDENGDIWWSKFNTGDLPSYTKLSSEPAEDYLTSTALMPDGTLYVSTTDTSSGYLQSTIYTMDPETMELTLVGPSTDGYADIAPAPNIRGGSLAAVLGGYVLFVDTATGDYYYGDGDIFQMFQYSLVGIAYAGSTYYNEYGFDNYFDWYFLIDSQGYVYYMGWIEGPDGKLYYLEHPDSTGGIYTVINAVSDSGYFGSAYFDGEFLYYSCFNEQKNVSTLYAIDTMGNHKAYELGNFGDGVWPASGLVELPTTDPEPEYTVEWKSATTSLNGTIDLNIYAVLSENLLELDNAFVRFQYAGNTVDVPVSEALLSEKDGVIRHRFSLPMYAKQISETVTFQFMVGDEVIGEAREYSIMQYCLNQISTSSKPEMVSLCKAMLNYAAAAQISLNYNTDNLANAGLSDADKVLPESIDVSAYQHTLTGTNTGIRFRSASLILLDEVYVSVYIELEDGYDISDFTFTIDGKAVEVQQNSKGYFIRTEGIPAKHMENMHTFQAGGYSLTYGPLSYVYNMLEDADTSPETRDLVKALYVYYAAAENYFG